jgi:hypothetical protein
MVFGLTLAKSPHCGLFATERKRFSRNLTTIEVRTAMTKTKKDLYPFIATRQLRTRGRYPQRNAISDLTGAGVERDERRVSRFRIGLGRPAFSAVGTNISRPTE